MNEREHCLEHSGCIARIRNLEREQGQMNKDIHSAHRRVDGMKNWVIAGMTSMILQLIVLIISVWAKSKGTQ